MRSHQPANHPGDVRHFCHQRNRAGLRTERGRTHGGIWRSPIRPSDRGRGGAVRCAVQPLPRHAGQGHPGALPAAERPLFLRQPAEGCRLERHAWKIISWPPLPADGWLHPPAALPRPGHAGHAILLRSIRRAAAPGPDPHDRGFIMNWEQTAEVVELPTAPTGPISRDGHHQGAARRERPGRRAACHHPGLHGLPHPGAHRTGLAGNRRPAWDRDAGRNPPERSRLHREGQVSRSSICSSRSSIRMSSSRPASARV